MIESFLITFFISGWGISSTDFFSWKVNQALNEEKKDRLESFETFLLKTNVLEQACRIESIEGNLPRSCHQLFFHVKKHLSSQKNKELEGFLDQQCLSIVRQMKIATEVERDVQWGEWTPVCLKRLKERLQVLKYQAKDPLFNLFLKSD